MQNNSQKKLELIAAKFSLIIILCNGASFIIVKTLPWILTININGGAIAPAVALSTLNSMSWVTICFGLLLANNLKILYFLLGVSFKTLVILLVVQQLKTGGEGYLQLQAFIYFISITIMLLATGFLHNHLFGSLTEEIVSK